jgi:cation diffusion facilitator CzcD-associated flavoprotein CzcO
MTSVQQADVVVCGAGIAGLAAAHALRDLDVVVLEADGRVGAGCARSAGTACGSTSAATDGVPS